MRFSNLILASSLVSLVAACGGGGEEPITVDPDVTSGLEALADSANLELLRLSDVGVGAFETTKVDTEERWDDAVSLTYVTLLEQGEGVVGDAIDDIPSSVSFASSGTGYMYVLLGEEQLTFTDGDVTGDISIDGTLDLSVSGTASSFVQTEANGTADLTVNVVTDVTADGCLVSYAFCGGDLTVSKDGADYTASLENSDFIAGIYGTSANDAEIGGMINYDPEDSDDGINKVTGSFVAGQ